MRINDRKRLLNLLAVPALVLASPLANAVEAGDLLLRVGVSQVSPSDSSGEVTGIAGSAVGVGDNTQPSFNITYMLTRNLGVELLGAFPFKHDLAGEGSIAALDKIGETKHLPPTLSLQYHFAPQAAVRPYAGIGLNYTRFFDEKSSAALEAALGGDTDISLDDSWGLAGQLGVDIGIKDDWFVNFDVRYIKISTEATLNTGGTIRTVDADIDPWVFSVGVGKSF